MEFDIFMKGSASDMAAFLIQNATNWVVNEKFEYIDAVLKKMKTREDFDKITNLVTKRGSGVVIAHCIRKNNKDVAENLLELGFPVNPIMMENLSEDESYERIVELCGDRSVHFEFTEYRESRYNEEEGTTVRTRGDMIIYLLCNGMHERAEFFLTHNKLFSSGEHVINYKPGHFINSCAIFQSGELIRSMNQLNLFSAAVFSGKKEIIEWVFDILR